MDNGFIAVIGNRSLGPIRETEEEANADKGQSPDARVLPTHEYILQLEAAVTSIEWLHASQKEHMKRLWKDSPPGGKA